MQSKKRYTLNASKLSMAYYEGLVQDGSVLRFAGNDKEGGHFVILNRFRSYESGTKWGRFHCEGVLSPGSTLKIYALAVDAPAGQADETNRYFQDSSVPWEQKCTLFEQEGAQFVNHEDILLYALTGEYLWIAIAIENGIPDADWVGEMFLDSQGDNFMWTFPEIYQEEGGFFHRYMSIFSSVYQNMADTVIHMDRYFDLDTAPMPALVEIAGWLGFAAAEELQDFLDEQMLRSLTKEIYTLNRMKGTKEVIRKLIRLVLGEEAFIVERNRLEGYLQRGERDTDQRLYGASMQDVTILLKKNGDEKLQSQMMYLINQFKPARSRVRLVFCPECSRIDTYCYLDYNAVLSTKGEGSLDGGARMNGTVALT